eukprot:GHRQ01023109.1.p1 GENE.GHRQ01023109.1~~GHRQ01023109.1.p1  ORF type:complete len:309 (+),score=83.09 GHRQ01023109.1:202-1128(+)
MQGLKSAPGVRSTRRVAPIASRSFLQHVTSRHVAAREQISVQQLVVETVTAVEPVEQQQEQTQVQVVKPVEQEHVVYSFNGNGKASQEQKSNRATTAQKSVAKTVENVEAVEPVEQQQEQKQVQVVKPVEQQEHVVNSTNGNGKASQEQKDSSDTTAQGSVAKIVPQAKVVRNLVFVTSEVAPWSKTGGLGDVLGSLPIALAARGHRVMVVTPRYAEYAEPTYSGTTIDINGNAVGMYHYLHKGVDWVFVDHPCYPRPGGIYADEHGVYGDNQVGQTRQLLQQAPCQAMRSRSCKDVSTWDLWVSCRC